MSPIGDDRDMHAFNNAKALAYHNDDTTPSARDLVALRMFPSMTSLRILDYGCGSGRFLRVLKMLGHDGMGMDISENAVKIASDSGVFAVVGNAETKEGFENLSGRYDIITALDVLEHTFNPLRVIQQLSSVLQPDGCIIASVPNLTCLPGRLSILAGKFPLKSTGLFDSGHIRWFTRSNLDDFISRDIAFSLVECKGTALPSISMFGLWRFERFQNIVLNWLATHWPSLWGYQFVFKLIPIHSNH